MASNILTTIVAPALGALTGNIMWLAPMNDVLNAYKREQIGELNPLPFSAATFSTFQWVYYAKIRKDYFIFVGNIFGMGLGLFYTLVSLYLLGINKNSKIVNLNADNYVFYTFLLLIIGPLLQNSYVFLFDSYGNDINITTTVVGITATLGALMYFMLPCYTLKEVITKKDASSIQRNLILANCINCTAWSTYGLAINDPWIYAINLVGLMLAVINMIAKLYYPSLNDISSSSNNNNNDNNNNGGGGGGVFSLFNIANSSSSNSKDMVNDTCC